MTKMVLTQEAPLSELGMLVSAVSHEPHTLTLDSVLKGTSHVMATVNGLSETLTS